MEFTSKKLKDSDLELTVVLDKNDLEQYVHQAVEDLKETVNIKGYRPGKVPSDVLKKNLGEDRIKENALNVAVQESLAKLIRKEKFDILDYSNLKVKENTKDQLTYTVSITLFPGVKLGEYKGVKIASKAISVTDEEISKTLKEIQDSRTEFKESIDSAKVGDRVEVDFEVTDNGVLIEGGKSDDHPLVLGQHNFVPGFEEQIEGMSTGDEKKFSLKMPTDYHEKNIAGKELDFKVVLKKVFYPVPPVLDDSFAQSLGNITGLEQLKENIKSGLFEEKKNKESERIKLAILDTVLEKTEVAVPRKFIETKLDTMVNNFDQELHGRGLELGLYLAHLKKTQEEFRKSFEVQAEKQVKLDLIIREVGKREEIKVAESEVDARLQEINAAINLQDEITKQGLDVETLRNRIRTSLYNEKIFQLLLKNTIVTLM